MPIEEIVLSKSNKDAASLFDCICKDRIADTPYEVLLVDNILSIKDLLESEADQSLLLSTPFLSVLHSQPPKNTKSIFGVVKKETKVIARFSLEILDFDAEERIKLQDHTGHDHSYLDQVAIAAKQFLAKLVKMRVVVMGSMLAAGPYGICFHESIGKLEREKIMSHLTKYFFESKQINASLFILKDLPSAQRLGGICRFKYPSYYEFTVQPTMIMHLDPIWQNLEDYKSSLHSKYRIKVNKVLSTGKTLEYETLNYEGICEHSRTIFGLYREVAIAAGFNMVELSEDYFSEMKKQLGENFDVVLVKHEEKLVGFYSIIMDGKCMHAHFLGYSRAQNKKFELYHNMLLSLLKEGMERKAQEINFARTALEIKSSIGAVPEELYSYIAHKSRLVNKVVPHILEFLKPKLEWTPRSPFK